MQTTVCKKCNRVVYVKDVNKDGYCCFCAPGVSVEAEAKMKMAKAKPASKKPARLSEIFKDEKVH